MKEKFRKLWKTNRKGVITVSVLAVVVTCTAIVIFMNVNSKEEKVVMVSEEFTQYVKTTVESETSMKRTEAETQVSEIESTQVTETQGVTKEEKADTTVNENTSNNIQVTNQEQTEKKQEEEPKTEAVATPIQNPEVKEQYVPISEGWKTSKSAKGAITTAQKADLDAFIETWKSGSLSDSELKAKIINYLKEQKIDYMEVNVTSQGYALYDKIPEINLKDGGNLYSFVGTYCTGKQNPGGTNKTVCYNWSVFVF